MPYHIDEENSELAFEVREGNKLVIKIKSNIFSDSLELYLIKVGDNTEPTDKNVFSSLRVLKEIENLHDTILKEINSVTSGFWELKQDSQGNEYIATKYNVLTEGGLTTYGLGEQKLGTIYDGLPIDNDTIYWEEVEGSRVLKAKGSGGGSTGLDETKLWNVLGTPGDQQIDYSHLRSAFSQFSNDFVTINTEQEITALKHFTAGLSVGESKKKIYEENGVVYIDADVAVTGAMTFYASAGRTVSTIMDAVTVDGITIKKENNVLKAVSGAGSSFDENAMWSALSGSSNNQINKSHLTNALAGYATESWVTGKGYATESWVVSKNYATTEALNSVSNKLNDFLEGSDTDNIINKWKELEAFLSGMAETDNLAEILETKADKKYVDSTFVTLSTKQTITGEKTFSSVLNTAAIKASGAITAPSLAASDWVTIAGIKLRKLEDGALMLEGNLALTGALTMYASNGQSFDTIYDGLPIDNDTIYWQEVDGSRVLKAREGSGSSFDKSAMWTALAGSTTEQINKSHLTTALTGYATESWVSGKNYAVKATTLAGYGITDGINAVSVTGTGNAVTAASISGHTLTLTKGSTFSLSSHKHAWADITSGKPSTLSGYGITDAYTKTESDNKYPTKTGSGASGTWGINVTGNAGSATKLQTARTLWGQSFNGTNNVSGDINNVGNINFTLNGRLVSNSSLELSYKNDDTTSLTFTGTVFRPFTSAHNNIDLGAPTVRWRDLYLGGNANIDGVTKTGDFYIGGIRLHKTADGVITLEGNLAVTGGITTYAIDPVSASTIMDGVVVDGTTIKKENGKLVAVGGGEAGNVAWDNVSGKPSVFPTNIVNITDLHSSWDSVLAAQKPAWLTAVSIATISDLHANWDALLKATPSAYVTRWPTISEVTNKQNLVIKLNGGTTEGTNQFTYNATAAKSLNITASSVGAAASSHNHSWSNITSGKPTTLAGYGITDAYTKTEADSRYINASGDTMTGALRFANNIWNQFGDDVAIGDCNGSGLLGIKPINSAIPGFRFYNNSGSVLGELKCNNGTLVYGSGGYTIWHSGNDGPGSGSNADLLDGYNETDFFRINRGYVDSTESSLLYRLNGTIVDTSSAGWSGMYAGFCASGSMSALVFRLLGGGQGMNKIYINYSVDGSRWGDAWRIIATTDSNVNSATQLLNKRNIWGQPFNGTADITGDMSNINDINMSGTLRIYGTNPLFYPSFGGGWYMLDEAWMRVYGNKNIYTEGMVEANGGFMAFASYSDTNSASHKLDIFNCAFKNVVEAYVNHNSSRSMLGWMDTVSGYGYRTRYVIGSERGYNSAWGKMYLAVSNNDNGTSIGCNLELRGDGWVVASGSIRANLNILADGGCSFYGSDIRYKSIMQQVNLSLLDIAKAPSFVYRWNRPNMNQNRLNLGGSAQYTQTILPWAVEENDNFLSMDYATVAYTFAVHTARHLLTYETRTDKKIKKLENRVKYLEKQLKKLGYEEVRTLDDSGIYIPTEKVIEKVVEKEVYLPHEGVIYGNVTIKGDVVVLGDLKVEGNLTCYTKIKED